MISKKILVYSLLSFFLGGIFLTYFIFIALLDSSVSRVNLLSSFIVREFKSNHELSAENIFAVIYDDVNFYTTYRKLAPGFFTASSDKTLCMSFRINPYKHDEKDYFSLINKKELERLITNKANFCFD